jgi:hypothetical protein
MRVTPVEAFVRMLVFGLLLGASSTAYADTLVITSFSFGNPQVTPTAGTVQFTPTGASTRAVATNSVGGNQDISSNTFPVAQSAVVVTFASSSATGDATNRTADVSSSVSLVGCTCTASAFAIAMYNTTFVIQGGDGNVDVTINPMPFAMGQVTTDQFGTFAHASISWTLTLNGVPIFSNDEMLIEVVGANRTGGFQLTPGLLSRVVTLQYGVPNTIGLRIFAASAAASAIPEPATVVLLVSGLGVMTGVLKKRRNVG